MSENKATEIAEKPGFKTSEFWLNFAAMVLGALIASGIFADGHIALRVAGLALTALSAMGYTGSRSKAKAVSSLERAAVKKSQPPSELAE